MLDQYDIEMKIAQIISNKYTCNVNNYHNKFIYVDDNLSIVDIETIW